MVTSKIRNSNKFFIEIKLKGIFKVWDKVSAVTICCTNSNLRHGTISKSNKHKWTLAFSSRKYTSMVIIYVLESMTQDLDLWDKRYNMREHPKTHRIHQTNCLTLISCMMGWQTTDLTINSIGSSHNDTYNTLKYSPLPYVKTDFSNRKQPLTHHSILWPSKHHFMLWPSEHMSLFCQNSE